jgi:DNA-binding HxlR family transcriptional regulator
MDFGAMHCSLARTLDVVGESWTPLVLRDLYLGVDRFDDLVRDLGVSRALLARRLEKLVEHGIVAKERYQDRPPRHRYRLTAAGLDLVPALMAMMAWGDRHRAPDGAPMTLTHDRCGHAFAPVVACGECGGGIDAREVTTSPGPGAAAGPGTWVLALRDLP